MRALTTIGPGVDLPLTVAVIGASGRGFAYSLQLTRHSSRAKVVALAERQPERRATFASAFDVPAEHTFADWTELVDRPRLADAAIIATTDRDHVGPALALLEKGYHLLIENPIAATVAECEALAEAARRSDRVIAVCHSMRYTSYTRALKERLDSGVIGQIVSVQHLKPIGYRHYAHFYVRGGWRREDQASSLLARSCHDLDWLGYIVGQPVLRVSSFGDLRHFRSENRPDGAADRCLDCAVEPECSYSAARMYKAMNGELSEDAIDRALREGPFGLCVYASDNDVCDHQVVNLEFDGGVTASFMLTGFTAFAGRSTRIFGTKGQITGDGRVIEVFDFLTETTTVTDSGAPAEPPDPAYDLFRALGPDLDFAVGAGDDQALSSPGESDGRIVDGFVTALAGGDRDSLSAELEDSLASHRVAFAAERSRRLGTVEGVWSPSPITSW